MAEYLVLIYENEAEYAKGDQGVFDEVMKAHNDFGTTHGASLRGGNALQPASTATTIRGTRTDSATVTDGPFAETKETLGGYYVIEAPDLDAAIEIAKQVPAKFGGVEVRPIRVFD
ncbi:MAG: hypothetical protein QOD07_3072 [Frankiaceae bacterium]|nr:hypothetical protein [Frankiaceae bacterium]